jgi:ferredoxin-thioredoxin reductase catalytic chain
MTDFEKTKEFNDLLKKHQAYAKKNNFCLNPNSDIIKSLILAIIKKKHKYGKEYCPCRRISGNKEIDEKITCPCVYHKKEIEEQGHCLCHLFFK